MYMTLAASLIGHMRSSNKETFIDLKEAILSGIAFLRQGNFPMKLRSFATQKRGEATLLVF